MNDNILAIKDLWCGYDSTAPVLKDLTLEIKNGDFVGILGPNGSGKTTLLRSILKIIPLEKGNILLKERNIDTFNPSELAQHLAFVPQLIKPVEGLTVEELVLLGRTPYLSFFAKESEHDLLASKSAMEKTNTSRIASRLVTTLSGGEFQRVVIARALAQEPKLLLLDEPTAHLDIHYQLEILNLLRKVETTVMATFHDLNLAAKFCPQVILLKDGQIFAQGSPEKVLTKENIKEVYNVEARVEKEAEDLNIKF